MNIVGGDFTGPSLSSWQKGLYQAAGGAGTPTAHLCYCVHLTLSEGQFISLLPVS